MFCLLYIVILNYSSGASGKSFREVHSIENHIPSFVSLSSYLMPSLIAVFLLSMALVVCLAGKPSHRPLLFSADCPGETTADLFSSKVSPSIS